MPFAESTTWTIGRILSRLRDAGDEVVVYAGQHAHRGEIQAVGEFILTLQQANDIIVVDLASITGVQLLGASQALAPSRWEEADVETSRGEVVDVDVVMETVLDGFTTTDDDSDVVDAEIVEPPAPRSPGRPRVQPVVNTVVDPAADPGPAPKVATAPEADTWFAPSPKNAHKKRKSAPAQPADERSEALADWVRQLVDDDEPVDA